MKKLPLIFLVFFFSCNIPKQNSSNSSSLELTEAFKSYWFDGMAEISTYTLKQSRYGSPREGNGVLIYVTEDFLPDVQVKANQKSKSTNTVLKLNRTKKFLTGIYPYSIMTSVFSNLEQTKPLVKTTTSIQEWCGQAYLQLNRRGGLEVKSHSYFEGEADQNLRFKDAITEEEIWNWIRTHPELLPIGDFEILPSLEYLQLKHKPLKLYNVKTRFDQNDSLNIYHMIYPELSRKLSIKFSVLAPFKILGWDERDLKNPDQITIAQVINTVKLPYWKLNKLGDERFRDSLGLN
jgi:hypothetical protein